MADPSLDIRIATTADTSGAQQAVDAIDELESATAATTAATREHTQAVTGFGGQIEAMDRQLAAKSAGIQALQDAAAENRRLAQAELDRVREIEEAEARLTRQRQADVQEATRRRDAREAEASAPQDSPDLIPARLGLAAVATGGLAARTALQSVSEQLRELIALAPEAEKELQFTAAAAQTFDVFTSPIASLKSALQSLAGLDDLRQSIENARQAKAALDQMIEARRQLAREAQARAFSIALQSEKQDIDAQTAALQRQINVLNARRALLSAQATSAELDRLAAGESPSLVAADRQVRQISEGVESLGDGISLAEQALENARREQSLASARYAQAQEQFGQSSKEADAAFLAFDAAGERLAQAAADLNAAQEIANLTAQRIGTEGLAGIVQNFAAAQTEVEEDTASSIAGVLATIEQSGAELSQFEQAAVARIQAILADNRVTAEETAQLTADLQLLTASQNLNLESIIALQRDGLATVQEQTRTIADLQNQLRDIRTQVQTLSIR